MFEVNSSDHTQVYTIKTKEVTCDNDSRCVPRCTNPEYGHLCRRRIECTCYDYTHGHLCKYVHKVKMLLAMKQPEENLDQLDASPLEYDHNDIVLCVSSPSKQKAIGLLFPIEFP